MALSLFSKITLATEDNGRNFSQSWMRTLETLLPLMRSRSDSNFLQVSPSEAIKYQGDFYGLLQSKNISARYFWVILRFNDMTSPVEYDGVRTLFDLPSYGYVDEQMRLYQTLYRKNT